ncbi:MAG: hypothetical protein RR131_04735 [Anaerovorax sp.]
MIKIKTFSNPYTFQDAETILLDCDAKVKIIKMESVYYPYKNMRYSLTLPGKLAKLDKEINCIVDLVYGRPAVGQGMPGFVEKEIEESAAMDGTLSQEELYRISYDFVFKLFLNRAKILKAPKITVLEEYLFYKMFYIVQCRDEEEQDYFVLVDSIEGIITILDWKAKQDESIK